MFDHSPNTFERCNSFTAAQFLVRCLPCGSKVLTPFTSEKTPAIDEPISGQISGPISGPISGLWSRIKRWFGGETDNRPEVASIPPGTRLLVRDMPVHL